MILLPFLLLDKRRVIFQIETYVWSRFFLMQRHQPQGNGSGGRCSDVESWQDADGVVVYRYPGRDYNNGAVAAAFLF